MKPYTVEIFRAKNKEWLWRATHPNGNEICRASESYQRRSACVRSMTRTFAAIRAASYTIEIKEPK